ncbi:hypothetical protein CSW66_14285 [Shigella boydii]|nr:hypothetical protein CBW45_14130 [Shigella flexneri]OUZ85236.1 hypothetical protein CBL22_14230 [Shigella flexneri]OXW89999.1 hypothetical protein CG424_14480 [Shigella boydii]PHU96969.1 hypothetical protein CSW66_14285 [Shigella boydii]PNP01571.1 hypothetical protein RK59_003455 [Shigella flexneri]
MAFCTSLNSGPNKISGGYGVTGVSSACTDSAAKHKKIQAGGNDSNLLIVFYVQIMPDDLVMQLHRF